MKKKIIYILLLLGIILIQSSLLPVLSNFTGDGVLMAVLSWAILDGFAAFLPWSIFMGVLYDLIFHARVGEHVLVFLFVTYFVSFFSRRIALEFKGIGLLLFIFFVGIATFASHAIDASLNAVDVNTIHGFWKSFGGFEYIFHQFINNIILFSLLFMIIKKSKRFFAIDN